jgi:hypothetical protein
MNFQNSKLAYIVVGGQIILAVILTAGVVGCLFYKNYSDPATLTAVILLDGTIVGNLASILGGPRQMMPAGTDATPLKTEVINKPDKPVPTDVQPHIDKLV